MPMYSVDELAFDGELPSIQVAAGELLLKLPEALEGHMALHQIVAGDERREEQEEGERDFGAQLHEDPGPGTEKPWGHRHGGRRAVVRVTAWDGIRAATGLVVRAKNACYYSFTDPVLARTRFGFSDLSK